MRRCGEVDTAINVDQGIEKGHMTNMLKVYAARPIARVSTLVRKLY